MDYLNYAYDVNQLDKVLNRTELNKYTWKIKSLLETDSTKEELVDGFFEIISELTSTVYNQTQDSYEEGYRDAKSKFQHCKCNEEF